MRRQLIWFLAAWFLLSGVYAPIRTAAWVNIPGKVHHPFRMKVHQ